MKCLHLTHSGHCADPTQPRRPPCTARLCAAKNEARPRHIDSMRGKTAQGRAEYIEIVRQSEGRLAADVLSDEVWRLIQARRDAAATRQEAAGGAELRNGSEGRGSGGLTRTKRQAPGFSPGSSVQAGTACSTARLERRHPLGDHPLCIRVQLDGQHHPAQLGCLRLRQPLTTLARAFRAGHGRGLVRRHGLMIPLASLCATMLQ